MVDPKDALLTAARYLKENPHVIKHVAVNARAFKVTVPLDALRYVVRRVEGRKKAPKDVVLTARPPALSVAATVEAAGAKLRAHASIRIDDVSVTKEEFRLAIRLADVKLEADSDASPIAALLKSGMLDLSKPCNLVRYLPDKSPALVEAIDDRLVVDLLREPKVAGNERFRKALDVATDLVGVRSIGTENDSLVIELSTMREGFAKLVARARKAIRRSRP